MSLSSSSSRFRFRFRFRSSFAVFVLASIATAAGVASTSACSDDDASQVDPAGDGGPDALADVRKVDGSTDPEEQVDAAPDAPVVPVVLPSCVGTSMPMNVSGVRAFVSIPLGTLPNDGGRETKGDFVVDFGSTGSTIDMHAFGDVDAKAPTPTTCFGGDAQAPGASCQFQGFEFFGDWGQVYLTTADHSTLFGDVRQAGIVATDFLAKNPFTLDFTHELIWRSDIAAFCTDAQLLGSGFRPLPAGGFYAKDTSKLRPLSEVLSDPDASATKNFTVPNVPTVPITVAGISALAQLDTGYEDRLARRSLNVNEALLAALQQQNLVTRDALLDLYVTTCVPGLSESLEGYHLAAGKTLEFVGEGGAIARTESAVAVYLKHRKPETFKCGGISTWTVPSAQIGASFFIDAQALILDPASSRVWIPKN